MKPFSDSELKALYLKLKERELALSEVTQHSSSSSAVVELDQSKVGRISRMDALQAQAISKATDNRRHNEFNKIKAALYRYDSGDYGFCIECGETISYKRLEIDPAATLCINCASKAEIYS
jgi:DnaK suppressor protein